ncbi:hypothetical protein J4E93_004823 [Alternaria ventricosa]|uniref:uncharacterized protein n=1 Tax=Alternaria ventricosa TaxID=1187951 RepID=UPI0020C2F7B9|nr:uncharacterized protein J4E93_004823 [Alternaria ventricosa]KAI4646602.1 hypothetical protein J4E93_004823 [Alternaria ventricosa]
MRFHLLFLALIPAVIASPSPDGNNREVDISSNVEPITATIFVYPSTDEFSRDRNDEETECNLEAFYGDRVEKTHDSNGKPCWKLSLIEGETVDDLRGWSDLDIPGVSYEERKQRFTKRKVPPKPTTWWAVAKDPEDTEANAKIFAYLKTKTKPGEDVYEIKSFGRLRWGPLHLSPEDILEVAQYPGILPELDISQPLIKCRAVTKDISHGFNLTENDEVSSPLYDTTKMIAKRSITWKRQQRATKDLMEDSRYDGLGGDLKSFIYDTNAGKGTWIYIIDQGVAIGVTNGNLKDKHELIVDVEDILQTETSKANGQSKETDDDAPSDGEPGEGSHGTMMACKAAGQRYGIAKQAKIVPVKILHTANDLLEGLKLAFTDIRDKDRALSSVVVVSQAITGSTTREQALQTKQGKDLLSAIDDIIGLGTPIVLAAGNERDEELGTREDIDLLPQVLEHPDMTPIINVGAAKISGDRVEDSQGGPQLSIYAPGDRVFSLTRDSRSQTFQGTSVAAPAVGGLIATYLGMDDIPSEFRDSTGIERVKAIREYLKSDKSSWVHKPGTEVRMIWNGADEDAHRVRYDCYPEVSSEDDGTGSSDCLEYMPATPPGVPAPEPESVSAGCSVKPSFGGGEYTVWGAGWADDNGARLKQDLGGTGGGVQDFVFNRGAGDEGREWTATFVGLFEALDAEGVIDAVAGHGVNVVCAAA